jgi:hypothetical protein
VPTLSVFFGIVIRMYYDDHTPPHFHAIYGEQEAKVAIDTQQVIKGRVPLRALRLVLDWAEIHQYELRDNSIKAQAHVPLDPIAPLE